MLSSSANVMDQRLRGAGFEHFATEGDDEGAAAKGMDVGRRLTHPGDQAGVGIQLTAAGFQGHVAGLPFLRFHCPSCGRHFGPEGFRRFFKAFGCVVSSAFSMLWRPSPSFQLGRLFRLLDRDGFAFKFGFEPLAEGAQDLDPGVALVVGLDQRPTVRYPCWCGPPCRRSTAGRHPISLGAPVFLGDLGKRLNSIFSRSLKRFKLLFLADLQPEFADDGSGFGQFVLEVVDLGIGRAASRPRHRIPSTRSTRTRPYQVRSKIATRPLRGMCRQNRHIRAERVLPRSARPPAHLVVARIIDAAMRRMRHPCRPHPRPRRHRPGNAP